MSGPRNLWQCLCGWKIGNVRMAISDREVAKESGAVKCKGCFKKLYKCKQCRRVFKYKRNFGKHVCGKYACGNHVCKMDKYKLSLDDKHWQDRQVQAELSLGEHARSMPEKMHGCKQCRRLFSCKLHLRQHLFKEHMVVIDSEKIAIMSAKQETEEKPGLDGQVVVSFRKSQRKYHLSAMTYHRSLVISGPKDLWRCRCGRKFGIARVAIADLEVAMQSGAMRCKDCFHTKMWPLSDGKTMVDF